MDDTKIIPYQKKINQVLNSDVKIKEEETIPPNIEKKNQIFFQNVNIKSNFKKKFNNDYNRKRARFKDLENLQTSGKELKKSGRETIKIDNYVIKDQKEKADIIRNKKKFNYKIIIIPLAILILLGAIIYFAIKLLKSKKEKPLISENFITSLTYSPNQIMRFQNTKTTYVEFDFGNMSTQNSSKKFIEYFDFIIGITNKNVVEEGNMEKEIFSGFVFLENYMIDNETHKMLLQNSSLFEDIESNNLRLSRNLEEKKYFNVSLSDIIPYCCIDNGTLPIIQFKFYRNGKIRKIYKPKNLVTLFYDRMVELLEKVIPKIANTDFNKTYTNISEALENEYEKIKNNSLKEDQEDEIVKQPINESEKLNYTSDFSDEVKEVEIIEREEDESKDRRLNIKSSNPIIIKIRNLEINDTYGLNDTNNNTFDDEEINQVINQEYNTENDFSINMFNKEETQGIESESNSTNNTNLNYYSHSAVRNDYLEFKGSEHNLTMNSTIDENEKALKEVHYSNQGRLVNNTNFEKDLEKDRQATCSNDNLLDCNDLSDDNEENIVNSQIESIDYEITEDIFSTGNFIDEKRNIIKKLSQIFNEYNDELEIIDNYKRANSSQRLLRDMTDYFLANKLEYSDVEIQIGNDYKRRRMEESSDYYGMKNMEYVKNLFSLNIIGIQMKLQIISTMKIREGVSIVDIFLQFAFIKITITLKKINTNMHLAIRNYNEMGYTELYLINESNEKLALRNENFSQVIINLEKDFSSLLVDKYDFGNIFKESFSDMYEKIKEFTSEIFQELIEIIRNAYGNYTQILEDVNMGRHEIFNEIRTITKKEYIDFIKEMLLSVEKFNNKTISFLLDVEEEVSKIENFQLDLLYDLIDIIKEAKKIFKDFNKNLFLAIEKGIRTFRLDFKDFVYEIMGDLLYLVEFLSVNLNKNEILKNGINEETREEITIKLKNMRNIINVIVDNLIDNIDLDYRQEMNETNINSIKVYSTEKLNEYLEDLEEKSLSIIQDIKNKIAYMNLYELYADNIDKIEEKTTDISNIFISDIYENTIEKINKLQPEYLKNDSQLIKKREELFEIVNNIDKNINNEITDINNYISTHTNDFKIRKQYILYDNLNSFRKSFLDSSMESLRAKFDKLLNDTINIAIKGTLDKNYNLGIQWLSEILVRLIPLHKRDECLQSEFWSKYSKYIKIYQSYLPNAYSEESIEIYRKYFNKFRIDILNNIHSKFFKAKYYYFNSSIYNDDFNFIWQIKDEIEYLISNLENYYTDDYFDMKIATNIYKYTTELLNPINDELYQTFENLKKKCQAYTDCHRGRYWGDYCWNDNRVLRKWHYISVPHTNNHKYLDGTFNNAKNFIKKETERIIKEFIDEFSSYLDNYLNEIQPLFDHLYEYSENKLRTNNELNTLINQYSIVLDDMKNIADSDGVLDSSDIEFYIENVKNKTQEIDLDFFENYYLNNFTSYLEYPDEVLYKIPDLVNKLKSCSDFVKRQINYIISRKILRVRKENHYFIGKTNDFFNKIIELNMKNKNIFEYYKEYRLIENLNTILQKYNYISDNADDYLTANIYDNKIINILDDYKNIISKIETRINEDWILQNCTEINITELSDFIGNMTDSNETRIVCYEYKNKSSLNYSEYNFNVVKIRTGIYFIKYLYEKLENLFNELNFDTLMNLTIIKQKDEIINDKNILELYEKSFNKISEYSKESEETLEEYFYYYEEDINDTIKNNLDFTKNFERFTKILNFTEENFLFEVNKKYNESLDELFIKLDEYKLLLKEQVNLSTKYEKYNFDMVKFKEETDKYLNFIKQDFNAVSNKIKTIPNDYLFNNLLKTRLDNLNKEKGNYIKEAVEELSKNYVIKPFNLTLNISQRTENIVMRILNNLMFNFIYDYIELYELNRDTFINSVLELIDEKKEEIVFKFNEITNEFFNEYQENSTNYINKIYLRDYEYNYTRCLNYSIDDLNQTLITDKENYNKYIIYQNKLQMCNKFKQKNIKISDIDTIKLNISNSNIILLLKKISDEEYYNYMNNLTMYNDTEKNEELAQKINILNSYLNELCEETFNNEFKFINETAIILDCDNNSYYTNYMNLTYFENFDELILNNLSKISEEYKNIIDSFYIGSEFIEEYIVSYNYIKLENYENFSTKFFKTNLDNFQDMSEYITYNYESKYNKFLKEELINTFNNSFTEFVKNVISGEIEDNFQTYVLDKIEINTKYIIEKIQNESEYYILLLNKTKELGITSKKALISLYDYISDRINKTLHYQIEDYISDNIVFFYRENKYLFRDNFINYYMQNSNNFFNADNIFELRSLLNEYIFTKDFNKTLDNISKELWTEWLMDNLNNKIQEKLENTNGDLSIILNEQKNKIIEELEKVETAELYESMLLLSEMINNYTSLVNEQNNRFKFSVSNLPMEKFTYFSEIYLEPPLNEIKEYYDMIQNELLKKINEIVSQMKDFYAEIQTEYSTTEQMNELFNVFEDTYNTLVNYTKILLDEINSYDDILVLYTYINSDTDDIRRLNNYLRDNETDKERIKKIFKFTDHRFKYKSENIPKEKYIRNNNKPNEGIRRIDNNDRINYKKEKKINYSNSTSSKQTSGHFNKKRKLSTHSSQGSVTPATLSKETNKLMKTLNNFNKAYLSNDFLRIRSNLLKEERNINKYILNSGRTIELSVLKLASIITEDKMNELKEILYNKHKQISAHVYNYMNLTSNRTDNYQYLLKNSSLLLENTFNEIDYIVLTDFNILKEVISGQIKEVKKYPQSKKMDINIRLFDLFQNEDLFKPVGFNSFDYENITSTNFNFTQIETINKYHTFLKLSKSKLLFFTEEKYKVINQILEEENKYVINKRRMSESKEDKDKNKDKDDFESKDESEFGLDFIKGELSFQYTFELEKDFSEPLKKLPIFKPIEIFSPLIIFLQPKITLGFEISVEFTTKLYEEIESPIGITIKLKSGDDDKDKDKNKDEEIQTFIPNSDDFNYDDVDDDDEDEDEVGDSKITITVVGKGEVSLAVNAGISIGVPNVFTISFLTGIQGLLGSGQIGFSLELDLRKLKIKVDSFYVIKAFYITFFLKLRIEINLVFTSYEFEIYIFTEQLKGLKLEKHKLTLKDIAKLIYMAMLFTRYNNILNNMLT